jgi:hypothetical protein
METAIDCIRPLLKITDNGEFVTTNYDDNLVNVFVSHQEISISYRYSGFDAPVQIYESRIAEDLLKDDWRYLHGFAKIIGNQYTVDARFITNLLPHLIELNETERELTMTGRSHPELDDCIAVFRNQFGINIVSWNGLMSPDIPKGENYREILDINSNPMELINDESFLVSTLFSGQFLWGVMIYRAVGNILL